MNAHTRETRAGRPNRGARPAAEELRVGELVEGRYRVVQLLGAGGMGSVYLCFEHDTERYVALKILAGELCQQPTFAARFEREARVTRGLQHANVVPVFDVGEHEGRPYIVMAYLQGETVEARLQREGTLALPEALALIRQVLSALGYIHARGLIHRDVKTANVILSGDGRATLLDFGVTRDLGDISVTKEGLAVGTPGYMAPEQALGDPRLDRRADLYAVGLLLFELLTGRLPLEEETNDARRLARQLRELPPDVREFAPEVPEAVAQVLRKVLSPAPEARYSTAEALARALELAAVENRFEPDPVEVPGPRDDTRAPARPASRSAWRAWAAALLAVLGLTAGTAALLRLNLASDAELARRAAAPRAGPASRG